MPPPARGFTLLELLVALTVFAIMASAAYSGLHYILLTQAALDAHQQRLAALQFAMYRLEQDITQAIPRSIRDAYGAQQPAMLGGNLRDEILILTRHGWDNPLDQPRATLQRVAYRLQHQQLLRLHWIVLDGGTPQVAQQLALLDQVHAVQVRFLNAQRHWQNTWPPQNVIPSHASLLELTQLPLAVEITLHLADWGEITRLLLLPD